jgi:N-methylhydantoinase B/oxoprolinase/acetone carboxylase alpha subunit
VRGARANYNGSDDPCAAGKQYQHPGKGALAGQCDSSAADVGDTPQITTPNSVGYCGPFERDRELVLADVVDGFATIELARRRGVAINEQTATIDRDVTATFRDRLATTTP